jgi:hypothetical protein
MNIVFILTFVCVSLLRFSFRFDFWIDFQFDDLLHDNRDYLDLSYGSFLWIFPSK